MSQINSSDIYSVIKNVQADLVAKDINRTKRSPITQFKDKYAFLGTDYPCQILWERRIWPTATHAYEAAHTLEPRQWARIRISPTTREALAIGSHPKNVRPDWPRVRLMYMEEIQRSKFSARHPEMVIALLKTYGKLLINGHFDKVHSFWGTNLRTGTGQNTLGALLTRIREDLWQTWCKELGLEAK